MLQFWNLHQQLNQASESSQAVLEQTNNDIAQIRSEYTAQLTIQNEIKQKQRQELSRLNTEYEERMSALESRTRTRRTTFV